MSVIWIDGFESYGFDSGDDLETEMLRRYETAWAQNGLTANYTLTDGRIFGKALTCQNTVTTGEVLRFGIGSSNILTIGFAFKHSSLEYDDESFTLISFRNGTAHQFGIYLSNSGVLDFRLYSTSTVLGVVPLQTGVWYYVEMKILCDNSIGEVQVKINGQDAFHITNVDTQYYYSSSDITHVNFYGIIGVSIDDLYVTTGEFLGPVAIECLEPTADGSTTNWSVSTGTDHYAVIDDQPLSTDYVYSPTVGEVDQLTLANLQYIDSSIKVVNPVAAVALSEEGARTFNLGLKLNSVFQSSTEVTSTSYIWDDDQFHTQNFDTSTDWTVASVNSLELNLSSQ